jgi:hypothetical protein
MSRLGVRSHKDSRAISHPVLAVLLCILIVAGSYDAIAQNFRQLSNADLTLKVSTVEGKSYRKDGRVWFVSVLQPSPFVEVHLSKPLNARELHPGVLKFTCEEVGVFA